MNQEDLASVMSVVVATAAPLSTRIIPPVPNVPPDAAAKSIYGLTGISAFVACKYLWPGKKNIFKKGLSLFSYGPVDNSGIVDGHAAAAKDSELDLFRSHLPKIMHYIPELIKFMEEREREKSQLSQVNIMENGAVGADQKLENGAGVEKE